MSTINRALLLLLRFYYPLFAGRVGECENLGSVEAYRDSIITIPEDMDTMFKYVLFRRPCGWRR